MFKKKVTFNDYNGQEQTEDVYFNINQLEATKLNSKYSGDVQKHVETIVKRGNMDEMLVFLEDIVLSAYGTRSEDGRRFIKTQESREEFENSAIYAELFMELLTVPEASKEFANKVMVSTIVGKKNLAKQKKDPGQVLSFDTTPEV